MSDNQLNPILVGKVIAHMRQKKGITQEVLSGFHPNFRQEKQTFSK